MLKAELEFGPENVGFAPLFTLVPRIEAPQLLTNKTLPLQARPAQQANLPCYPRLKLQGNLLSSLVLQHGSQANSLPSPT